MSRLSRGLRTVHALPSGDPVRRTVRAAGLGGVAALSVAALLAISGCGVAPAAGGPLTRSSGAATATSPTATAGAPGSTAPTSSGSSTPSTGASPTPSSSPTPTYPSGPPMLLDSIIPADSSTVGVAMPIIVVFTNPVKTSARKDIEKAMTLTSTKAVTGAWHWFGYSQVDFRPKGYWPSGAKVTLDAELDHVGNGNGRYGTHSYKHTFAIGNDFETKISASQHTTKVYEDGNLVKSWPSDAGSPQFPSWTGTMTVVSKTQNEHMTSCSAGITCDKKNPNYYDGFYPWAVRLTNSGTFVHYSSSDPYPGHSFGSHGCVHLSLANATWYFNHVSVGDPVTITGSPRGRADATNGFPVYNLSWSSWQQDSGMGAIRI